MLTILRNLEHTDIFCRYPRCFDERGYSDFDLVLALPLPRLIVHRAVLVLRLPIQRTMRGLFRISLCACGLRCTHDILVLHIPEFELLSASNYRQQ